MRHQSLKLHAHTQRTAQTSVPSGFSNFASLCDESQMFRVQRGVTLDLTRGEEAKGPRYLYFSAFKEGTYFTLPCRRPSGLHLPRLQLY